MVTDINEIIAEIQRLENQLEARWDTLREQFHYTLEGHTVRFANGMRRLHRRYRTGILPYLRETPPAHIFTAPVIYAMFLPLLVLDVALVIYQQVCFRAYGVPRVARGDYLVIDRHQLGYLNGIEKINCVYCGYVSGLMGMAQEIVARTEQYWCPIKHARRVRGMHQRYPLFAEYGDAENYQATQAKLRTDLRAESATSGR